MSLPTPSAGVVVQLSVGLVGRRQAWALRTRPAYAPATASRRSSELRRQVDDAQGGMLFLFAGACDQLFGGTGWVEVEERNPLPEPLGDFHRDGTVTCRCG
jgi:hypothetical protein